MNRPQHMLSLIAACLLAGGAASIAQSGGSPPVRRAAVEHETEEMLDMWGGACSLYCAVGPSVRASSRLTQSGHSYPAEAAHDFDISTAWVEGKPGHGVGEYLEYTYDLTKEPVQNGLAVTTAHIFNGYRKSRHLWKANSRVRRFKLLVDGRPHALIDLVDTPKMQTVEFKPVPLPQKKRVVLRFEIVSVYAGTRYQDTAVTDITFDGTGHH
jgi:hypothetical protein